MADKYLIKRTEKRHPESDGPPSSISRSVSVSMESSLVGTATNGLNPSRRREPGLLNKEAKSVESLSKEQRTDFHE